jgi:quercetin dioxygenase-like cupin family protein
VQHPVRTALHTPTTESQWRVAVPVKQHPYSQIAEGQGIWVPSVDSAVAVKVLFHDVDAGHCTRLVHLDEQELLPLHSSEGQRTLLVWSGALRRGAQVLDHGVAVDEPWSSVLWRASAASIAVELIHPVIDRTMRIVDTSTASWVSASSGVLTLDIVPPSDRRRITLVDLQAGTSFHEETHAEYVERFVLAGAGTLGDVPLARGDYLRGQRLTGSELLTAGPQGCVVLRVIRR